MATKNKMIPKFKLHNMKDDEDQDECKIGSFKAWLFCTNEPSPQRIQETRTNCSKKVREIESGSWQR